MLITINIPDHIVDMVKELAETASGTVPGDDEITSALAQDILSVYLVSLDEEPEVFNEAMESYFYKGE